MKLFIKTPILYLISFYQKFLTTLAYGSCRYYPTCSEYAKQQFQYNNIFKAFFFSSKRILACNHLFIGGLDYPIVSKVKLKFHQKIQKIDFWLVPTSKDSKSYYLVKNFSNIKGNFSVRQNDDSTKASPCYGHINGIFSRILNYISTSRKNNTT